MIRFWSTRSFAMQHLQESYRVPYLNVDLGNQPSGLDSRSYVAYNHSYILSSSQLQLIHYLVP
jgi:hypothetical protein